MIDFINKLDCTGCFACYSACPQQAIKMQEDKEGFLFPEIDEGKCINCGICQKVCPIIKEKQTHDVFAAYAVQNRNNKIRKVSSSGGAFTALAEKVIERNGVVFGAKFNKDFEVVHGFTETKDGLAAFRGSKYVQSRIGDSYIQAKEFLENTRQVLFSGTPCQIAGLKSFLGKNYDNLLTVDLICHGVPNPKFFKRHLEDSVAGYKKLDPSTTISKISFREKRAGWSQPNFVISIYSPLLNKNFEIVSEPFFNSNLFKDLLVLGLRHSCYNCQFKSFKNCSDITIGDFWGIKDVLPDFYDEGGVSVVLINSQKGVDFYKSISVFSQRKVQTEDIVKHNSMLWSNENKPKKREDFFEKNVLLNPSLLRSKKIGILTLKDFFNRFRNYGCILQTYALMTLLKGFGHQPILINHLYKHTQKIKGPSLKLWIRALTKQFVKKYLLFKGDSLAFISLKKQLKTYNKACKNLKLIAPNPRQFDEQKLQPQTKPCFTKEDLYKATKDLDMVIVGSDQVWRPGLRPDISTYFCDFLDDNIKRMAYAASFGTEDWYYTEEQTEICKNLLQKFFAVSVREADAVEKCRKFFNKDAVHLLDPTLLLDTKDYEKLVTNFGKTPDFENKYLAYILGLNKQSQALASFISKVLKKQTHYICIYDDNKTIELPHIEEWVSYFVQTDFVFTDSYHGCVFSIIFNKPFLVFLNNNNVASARHISLLKLFGLEDRIISQDHDEITRKINTRIDWERVNTIRNFEREKSLSFLRKNLNYD